MHLANRREMLAELAGLSGALLIGAPDALATVQCQPSNPWPCLSALAIQGAKTQAYNLQAQLNARKAGNATDSQLQTAISSAATATSFMFANADSVGVAQHVQAWLMANEVLFVGETQYGLGKFTVAQKQAFWNKAKALGFSAIEYDIVNAHYNVDVASIIKRPSVNLASYREVNFDPTACYYLGLGAIEMSIAGAAIEWISLGTATPLVSCMAILAGVMYALQLFLCQPNH
jgi:hypothetical protein